jgi:hypothetical protein
LDEILEKTRADEERIKRETREGLEGFRKLQEEADKKARENDAVDEKEAVVEEEIWVAGGRKRKRTKEKEVLKGVKIRRTSTTEAAKPVEEEPPTPTILEGEVSPATTPALNTKAGINAEEPVKTKQLSAEETKKPPAKAGLVDYGSDEDDDW